MERGDRETDRKLKRETNRQTEWREVSRNRQKIKKGDKQTDRVERGRRETDGAEKEENAGREIGERRVCVEGGGGEGGREGGREKGQTDRASRWHRPVAGSDVEITMIYSCLIMTATHCLLLS